jgi:uncharacterized membrane protein
MARAGNGHRLGRMLGWMSLGLGAAQVVAPASVNRLVGLRGTRGGNAVMRAVGAQELAVAGGLLARPYRPGPLWARATGDAVQLGMLARAARDRDNDSRRVAAAAAAVAGAALLDVVGAARRGRRTQAPGGRLQARATITVNRPPAEVYRAWRDLERLPEFMHHLESVRVIDGRTSHWIAHAPAGRTVEWDAEIIEERPDRLIAWRSADRADVPNEGTVRFAPAPRDEGTEIRVELAYQIPGGRAGATVAALFGEEPHQQLKDDLRRFKQVVEIGEVVRSEGSPEGTLTHRLLRQEAAQPAG